MNDDSKKAHDFFGLSEISQIQDEIEKNLSGMEENPEPEPPVENSFLLIPQEVKEDLEIIPTADFYRETIKEAPEKSWAKVAVILLFVCTIGTGMFGFGIGTGLAYFTSRNTVDNVNTEISGNIAESIAFIGNSYVFESVSEIATLSDMVELIAPSVVGITTYNDLSRFPFLPPTSYGSGIIFAETYDRIFIATNLYVVRGGYRWDVSIEGSPPIAARPVGIDGNYDLAVAFIYKEQLVSAGIESVSFANFGDSDEMRIGEVVLAIGNAMGEGTSVTRGIISAAERPIILPAREYPLTLFQTDAAINYGNSGGPLINTKGEIIGININQITEQIIGTAQVEGMGYSISSNIAAPILENIVANYRTPAIGIIGISLSNDNQHRAEYWGIPELGVLVIEAQEGRAADIAGIRANDVITSFDGQPIFYMEQLQEAIRASNIGDIVEVRILRGGSFALTLQVELSMLIRDTFSF
ncbi:MAG: S1C family serine protease [Defluviitaleaceae bacterium]|nr:S1C family serine protease [Defluviitaleaceae bacterium]